MFCPYCANLLVVEPFDGEYRFACKTCPYIYNIGKRLKKSAHIEQKKVCSAALRYASARFITHLRPASRPSASSRSGAI